MHEGDREPCRRNVLGRGTEAAEAPRTGSGEGSPGYAPWASGRSLGLILSAWALWFSVSFIPLIFCREQVLLS